MSGALFVTLTAGGEVYLLTQESYRKAVDKMTFELISVGTELLLGQIVNTNAQYLSRRLSELGFDVYYTTVVGDNPGRLKSALETAAGRADGIITTGGLGPTGDDLTKETIANYCGLKCVMDDESKRNIIERFNAGGMYMPESNLKQAEMPEGCIILKNDFGTAPGAIVEYEENSTTFIMLPGPPREMKPMFDNYVFPYLKKRSKDVIRSKSLRVFGLGESSVDERLSELINNSANPTVAPYAKTGEVELRITAKAESAEIADEMIVPVEKKIREALGDKVYGTGLDNSLQKTLVELLRAKGLTAATAESCTGGLTAQKITSIPGSSECFGCGLTTYSNEIKHKLLGVKNETLEKYGAVSAETALEMSKGALKVSGADMAVSITGIAGPGGGTAEKPVGLVYISVCAKDIHKAYKFNLTGDRGMVRERSSMYALDLLRRAALGILDKDAEYIW